MSQEIEVTAWWRASVKEKENEAVYRQRVSPTGDPGLFDDRFFSFIFFDTSRQAVNNLRAH